MRKRQLFIRIVLVLVATLVVVNWTWGRLPDEPAPRGMTAQLGDLRVHYVERPAAPGAGAAPAVLLLHGLPGTAADFERVTPLLPRMRTIALDRPGYGASDGGAHGTEAQLAAIEGLLDRLGIRRAIVVGHSYGGTLALAFAARRPERVRALVLVAAAAGGERTEGLDRAQARYVQALSLPLVQPAADLVFSGAMRRLSAQSGAAKAFDPDPVDPAYEQRLLSTTMRHEDLDAYAAELRGADELLEQVDAQAPRIAVPAVVIQGAGDRLVAAENARRLAAALPRARLVELPGGHMVPLVRPAVVAEAVRICAAGCGTH
ncbi:alpha/beta hydrolase [Conexibacter stalactiti]|uniref:Alpha/beta hydrolase n=1 Tax=Conexibacter stalactiti TaxID=1940611 RepID=A0ABU4HL06_9ACTN|nr:alpha/beta hydrolase [Conexibacter stalactiti]MDW5594003.1 alpha/beta hydrolase [Conexibacter stalactiti]MEC5034645.1 alpha/beta hydrolase [Conexibacter stalactiti]